ncbi:MAG TPA: PKD domain-containing protein [Candidatus Thermoplasmatota archaeon]|nr:PKD domain-containing protein [Candidatus Thermoplasmatota archaeon]
MRAWLVGLLVVAALLSGCSGKNDDSGDTTTPAPTTGGATTTGPAPTTTGAPTTSGPAPTTGGGSNQAPVATVEASTEGGALPLLVTFTLDGSDEDGDDLDWTFDADEDGETEGDGTGDDLPAEVEFTYEAAGVYNATFTLSDGTEESTRTVSLTVVEGGPATVVFVGHVILPDPYGAAFSACLMEAVHHDLGTPGNVTGNIHDLSPDTWGWSYSFAAPGYMAQFWDATPAIVGAGESGTVPDGAVQVFACGAAPETANTDYTLTLSPP